MDFLNMLVPFRYVTFKFQQKIKLILVKLFLPFICYLRMAGLCNSDTAISNLKTMDFSFSYDELLQVGKFADLVLWKPSFFGAKPEMVVKGGAIAWANMGDPNASIPTPEPVSIYTLTIFSYVIFVLCRPNIQCFCYWQVLSRPMFGAFGKASSAQSIAFVSKA